MSRPTINKEALKAAFEAALNPEVRQAAVPSPPDRKRRASDTFEMPPAKLAKTETEAATEVADHMRTADNSHETPPEVGDMTLAVLSENSSEEGFRVPSPQDGDSEQDAIEEDSDDRRRYESDGMLAQAYRELSEASTDMATWYHATSVALEEKLAAERREIEAASQMLMAQGRYEQATERISQAAAHRHRRAGV